MPDPIERLSNFERLMPVSPMSAAEVRHRGDRLRKRNNALTVTGIALTVALMAAPIVVLAGGDRGGRPQPAEPELTGEVLLTADEVPARERLTPWRKSAKHEGEVFACAPPTNTLTADAAHSLRRDFEADMVEAPPGDKPVSVVRTVVLQFADDAAARDAYRRTQGWISDCPAGHDLAAEDVSNYAVDIEGGQGEVRRHDFFASDICTECDAIRFHHMGVAQFSDRLVMVSFAEVGGPQEPEGLEATMKELFDAAVIKAGGSLTTASSEPGDLADFPLAAGMPDVSDNSDYLFEPPSAVNQAMISARELMACGNSPPETGPLDRLTTRLAGPSDAHVRELQMFHDQQEAVTYVAHLRNLYRSCPTSDSGGAPPTFTTTVREGPQGEESLDIRRASDGVGRSVITVVRIENAVLVEIVSDEGMGAEVDALAMAAHKNLTSVITAMSQL